MTELHQKIVYDSTGSIYFLKIYFIFSYVYVRVSLCMSYTHVPVPGEARGVRFPWASQAAVRGLTWMLGLELRPPPEW